MRSLVRLSVYKHTHTHICKENSIVNCTDGHKIFISLLVTVIPYSLSLLGSNDVTTRFCTFHASVTRYDLTETVTNGNYVTVNHNE